MRLDLRRLRHILALDRYRNFARAADAIALTQSALSRSIQVLEEEIGAKLFDRNQARVEPTAVGSRLVELARPLLSQAKFVESELQQMVGLAAGLVRIGAGPYAAEISVGTAIGRLVRQHPGIQVDVSIEDWPVLYQRLLAEELDVAVIEASHAADDDRVVVEPLGVHSGVFYCRSGHPLAGKLEPTLNDIRRYPIALATTVPERLREQIGQRESASRGEPHEGAVTTGIRVAVPSVARQIVLESHVVGVALPRQLRHEIASGCLVILPLEVPWLKTSYGIIRLAGRTPSPATLQFLKLLREVESGLEADGLSRVTTNALRPFASATAAQEKG